MRIIIVLLAMITSCSVETKPAFSEISGENYTIQVISFSIHGDERETSGYKVRVFPTQKVSDEQGKQHLDSLLYQTDSFYITQGDTQIKPERVQSVAIGTINCYEFILAFDGISTTLNDELTLVFNDNHITKEKYLVKLLRKR